MTFRLRIAEKVKTESLTEPQDGGIVDIFDERFDGLAFNGLVDGAGEFPLWENDSRKL